MTEDEKKEIDAMSRIELARRWRFATDDFWQGERGAYAQQRFNELGGFSPVISKLIGW